MNTVPLKIDSIVPNKYNPNRMTEEQFQHCTAEIKLNGDALKPVVVRLVDGHYVIVDGEQSWRAAKAAGLAEITCQVIDCDGFEAMRQTLVRNEHGTHNPVLEAMLYQQMMAERKLSIRGLAKAIEKPSTTMGKKLKYLEVYELHKAIFGDEAIERIGALTQAQIDMCHAMPPAIGKIWLAADTDLKIKDWVGHSPDRPFEHRLRQIVDLGLASLLSPKWHEFAEGIQNAVELSGWAAQHLGFVASTQFVQPVMRLKLPVGVLDALPRRIVDGDVVILLPADKWATLLAECASRGTDEDETITFARVLVRKALREEGIDPASIASPKELAQHEVVLQAPKLVRTADFLSLDEQCTLTDFARQHHDATAQEAVQRTVEHFRQRRTVAPGQEATAEPSGDIRAVLEQTKAGLIKAQKAASTEARTSHGLVAQIMGIMMCDDHGKLIADESECRLLEARLSNVPLPELVLLADTLDPDIESYDQVIDNWRASVDRVSTD